MQNQEFQNLTADIRRRLPYLYLTGILTSYFISAVLIGFFIFPILDQHFGRWSLLFIVPGVLVIQFFRLLIVFTDQLNGKFTGGSKLMVFSVALAMTVWGLIEAWHLINALPDLTGSQFAAIYGFAASIVVAGFILEVSFVNKTAQITQAQGKGLPRPSSNGKAGALDSQLEFSLNANGIH